MDPLQWARLGCRSCRRSGCKVCLSCHELASCPVDLVSGVVCWFALKSGQQSERHSRQYTWCWVLWEIVSKEKNYHLIHSHRPTAKQV